MSYFMQSGDVFSPTAGRDSVLDGLPVGNYIVIETMQGLMFKKVDSFTENGKMYGNVEERVERILNTFDDRPRTTGVLLSGEKGSGKSQLARNVSLAGYDRGYPTILVNAPFCGDAFNALLASIEQPAIVLMDEFEKVYSHTEQQEAVLTLLDGMMTSKKLFILTVNDHYRVNEHMKNRPGRIYYSLEFSGLEADFVREYCEDNLHDAEQIEGVIKVSAMFKAFNFDMLKAIVEEMNRYKETAFDAIAMLNAKPFTSQDLVKYEASLVTENGFRSQIGDFAEIPLTMPRGALNVYFTFDKPHHDEDWKKLASDLNFDSDDVEEVENDNCNIVRSMIIESKTLKRVDVEKGLFEFTTPYGIASFVKKREHSYDIREALL
jgi:hypothetical protein